MYVNDGNYCETLIAYLLLLEKDNLGDNAHFEYNIAFFFLYGQRLCDFIYIAGYNCKVNQTLVETVALRLSVVIHINLISCLNDEFA